MANQKYYVQFKDDREAQVLTEEQINELNDTGDGETPISKIQSIDKNNEDKILGNEPKGATKSAEGTAQAMSSTKSN